jgi:hypothetical protein
VNLPNSQFPLVSSTSHISLVGLVDFPSSFGKNAAGHVGVIDISGRNGPNNVNLGLALEPNNHELPFINSSGIGCRQVTSGLNLNTRFFSQ